MRKIHVNLYIHFLQFEEYISAALASVRYREFLAKGKGNNVIITGTGKCRACTIISNTHEIRTGGDDNSIDDFNPLWISEFTKTTAYDVWQRSTDPMLFDIVEPRFANFPQQSFQTLSVTLIDTHVTRSPLSSPTWDFVCPKDFKN